MAKKQVPEIPKYELQKRILVSFNHSVAVVVDGRFILTGCAVCEEIFQGKLTATQKNLEDTAINAEAAKLREKEEITAKDVMTIDYPMFFRVLSLGDGKPLRVPCDIMVKWNNISAICELRPEDH